MRPRELVNILKCGETPIIKKKNKISKKHIQKILNLNSLNNSSEEFLIHIYMYIRLLLAI